MRTIFRDFDQTSLDAQYNNRAHVPEHMEYYQAWEPMCADVRSERVYF